MKKTLVMLALGLLSGCTPPDDERVWELTNNLVSNTTNTERYIAFKDFESGIEDLRKLVGLTYYEELWAYVPEEDMWVEIGSDESHSEEEIAVIPDAKTIEELIYRYDEVVFVHYHPLYLPFIEGTQRYLHELMQDSNLTDDEILDLTFLNRGMPSLADLEVAIQLTLFSQGTVKNVVCGFHGFTEYDVKREVDVPYIDLFKILFTTPDYEKKLKESWQITPFEPVEFEDETFKITFHPY